MKRKNDGQLTIGKKQFFNNGVNASEFFFNNGDLIYGRLCQFIDEYDKVNLARVNKACNDAIYHNAPKDRHFMFNYFVRNGICMVCLQTCIVSNTNTLGLYAHKACMPSRKLFVLDSKNTIPIHVAHTEIEPGMTAHCLYEINVPFIINNELTLSYHTSRKFSCYHEIYTHPKYKKYDDKLRNLVQSINKVNYIKQKIDLNEKVRVGSNLISLHTMFVTMYPNIVMDVHTTINRYNELRSALTNLHNEMVRFFSEFVRPNIYVKSDVTYTWGHFVKYHESSLCNNNNNKSFIKWIITGSYLEPNRYSNLKNMMKGWVAMYNDRQLKKSLKCALHQVANMIGETFSAERINIYRSVDTIVENFCDGSDEFRRIIDSVQPSKVFAASAEVLCCQIQKVSDMFIDLYLNILKQDEMHYRVKGVRICDFNIHIKRLISRFGIFHFDLSNFPKRFLTATLKFHPIDVFNTYSPDTFFCDNFFSRCENHMKQRKGTCLCGSKGQLCEEHSLCLECCYCFVI